MVVIDSIWVWILDFEGGDGVCDVVEVLLDMGVLFGGVIDKCGLGGIVGIG